MWKSLPSGIAALVAFAAMLAAPAAPAAVTLRHSLDRSDSDGSRSVREFWTPQRMERAQPLDSPIGLLDPAAVTAARKPLPSFTSGPVAAPESAPFRAAGKVFLKLRGEVYTCSAAIVRSKAGGLIWTAGHCLREPGLGGRFASKVIFVPAYDDGSRPFGIWKARAVGVPRGWGLGNQHYDFGAAMLAKRNGSSVSAAVGAALPFDAKPKAKQRWTAIGYPAAKRFGDRMWSCQSKLYRRDRFRGSGPDPLAIGCDMTGGASGGPWLTAKGKLGAVSSYLIRREPGALFGTYMGGEAGRIYRRLGGRG